MLSGSFGILGVFVVVIVVVNKGQNKRKSWQVINVYI